MSKGNRNHQQRRPHFQKDYIPMAQRVAFVLDDTPDNRDLVAMLTGQNAARFATGTGTLDNTRTQKNSGDCEAVTPQSPLIP